MWRCWEWLWLPAEEGVSEVDVALLLGLPARLPHQERQGEAEEAPLAQFEVHKMALFVALFFLPILCCFFYVWVTIVLIALW